MDLSDLVPSMASLIVFSVLHPSRFVSSFDLDELLILKIIPTSLFSFFFLFLRPIIEACI